MKDVAKLAGVSLSTTSYALNGSSKISEPTRQKVIEAARQLNFSPNAAARSLKTKKTNIIGVILSEFVGSHFSPLLAGMNEIMMQNGYDIIVLSGIKTGERFIRERLVDGMILVDSRISDSVIEQYSKADFPFVLLDRKLESEGIYNVMIDNKRAFTEIMNMHLKNNCQNIAYFSGEAVTLDNKYRYDVYNNVLNAHNITYRRIFNGDFQKDQAYNQMKQFLSTNEVDFDAVACANDLMAIGVINALTEAGFNVPKDISVSGFDNHELGEYCTPTLTTYHVDLRSWGKKAADIMLRALANEEEIHTHEFEGYLVQRQSTSKKSN